MEVRNIPLGMVRPSPMNPRKTFDEDAMRELAENIRHQGLLQPITVRPRDGGQHYEIVCGERRYRAVLMLRSGSPRQCPTIAAIVRDMNDDEAFDAMITENLQRRDVDPMEEAYAFSQLMAKGGTAEEIALRFGKSTRFVQDRAKLTSLIPELAGKVKSGDMAIAGAMIIAKFSEEMQRKFLKAYGGMSRIGKDTATRFADSAFMSLSRAPWQQSGDERDRDFAGGCGHPCRQCRMNTASANSLFWEMLGTDGGKCTSREGYQAKHRAYLDRVLREMDASLVKAGEPLPRGKTVLLDTCASFWSSEMQQAHDDVVREIRSNGYEILAPESVFAGRVYHLPDDERVAEMLSKGECYRCIDVFSGGALPSPRIIHYYTRHPTANDGETSAEIAEVSELARSYRNNEYVCEANIQKSCIQMASGMGHASDCGELTPVEREAADILLLSQLSPGYIRERYSVCGTSRPGHEDYAKIAKDFPHDRAAWVREHLRTQISRAEVYTIAACVGEDVMRAWAPEAVAEAKKKHEARAERKNEKIRQRLAELGYDTEGNKTGGQN